MKSEPRVVGLPQLAWGAIKLAFFAIILATPLAGAWISSSLAAYENGSPRLCLSVALLLFPVLPLLWEGVAAARSKTRRTSRFLDRLILRTMFLNVAFLGVLLWRFPSQAYVATSTRGDWFLDGRDGAVVDVLRSAVFQSARGLKWLHEAAQPNPYKKKAEDDHPVVPTPVPVPERKPESDEPQPDKAVLATALWPQRMELHHAVREIPASEETSIDSVALYLRAHSEPGTDRVKALHDWVVDRIAYDVEALRAAELPEAAGDADATFKNRKGVCAGYARLLRALAAVTGDQIEYVDGDARGTVASPHGDGHAWNAAFVEGSWHLVDPTWDAGYVDGDKFVKRYSTDWLFTPPEVFGITHFPESDAWQLREHPIERGVFMRLPLMRPAFYRDGFKLLDPDRSQVTVQRIFEARVERSLSEFLLVAARPVGGGAETHCTVSGTSTVDVKCAIAPGVYEVMFFDAKQQYGDYDYIGEISVNVSP